MKKKSINKYILSFLTILLVILACTKDVGLYTEVEFELTETHEIEGYINTALATAITVIPEEIVEGYSYSYSYKINSGAGYFEDESGTIISEGDKIALDPLSASLNYIATTVGDHAIVFTATDSFGFAEQVIATYTITNVPVTWTATNPTNQILLGDTETITIVLGSETQTEEVTYQRNYSFIEGTGTLTTSEGNNEVLNDLVDIAPGGYELTFTATELGISTIEFLLEDSNGQELIETISFEVVAEVELSSENTITEFELDGIIVSDPDNNFTITLPSGTDITSLTPTIEHNGVSISPASETSQDFSNPVTYVVTAENDAIQEYIVTVEVEIAENDTNSITSFELEGVTVTNPENEFTITLPAGTDVTALTPTINHNGESINPDNSAQDFSNPVTYTVTAENGDIQEYTVTIELEQSDLNSIETFEINGVSVSNPDNEFTITLPAGTDITALLPEIFYIGQSLSPSTTQDFSTPIIYTVTAENGDTQEYIVTVELEEENQAPVAEDFSFDVNANTDINTISLSFYIGDQETDNENLIISIINFSSNGQSAYNGQENIIYTPEEQWVGEDQITYEIIDEGGLSDTGVITINVIAVSQTRPVAVAESDVTTGGATLIVQFTGSNSYDDDNDELTYLWDFGDGNTSIEADPLHSFTTADIYEVTLTVTDDGASELSDTATIEIIVTEENQAPIASINAVTFANTSESVSFDGSGSSDTDGSINSYEWNTSDGQTSNLTNPNFTFATAGTYTVTLTVTDDGNPALSSNEVSHDITIGENQIPTVNAGDDAVLGPFDNQYSLEGVADDSDGIISTILWEEITGASVNILSPNSLNTNVSDLSGGTYMFKLTVTDNSGGQNSDIVEIRVVVCPASCSTDESKCYDPDSQVCSCVSNTDPVVLLCESEGN